MDQLFIEITFNDSISGHLRMCGFSNVMTLSIKLDFGNITHASQFESRKDEYIQNNFCFDEPERFVYENKSFEVLNDLKHEKRKIRIWAGTRDSEELCGLYFLTSFLKEQDIYWVEIPVDQNESIGKYDTFTYTSQLRDKNQISYKKIDKSIKYEFEQKWFELTKINSDLRIFKDNKLCSINYEDVANVVLDVLDDEEEVMQLVGKLIDDNQYNLNYNQLLALMNYLIRTHLVIITKKIIKNAMYGENYLYIRKNIS